jgi:hypothetical protein
MRINQRIIKFENELHKEKDRRKTFEKLREDLIKKGKKSNLLRLSAPKEKHTH